MLERPSNIFERVQKCYKTFKRFITCYNGLYDNVIRCANRSNILFFLNMLYDMFERFAPGFTRKLDTMHYYYYQGNEYKQSQIKQKFYN